MNLHLSDDQLLEHAEAGFLADSAAAAHLATCRLCAERASDAAALLAQLGRQAAELDPPHDLWPGVAKRIADSPTGWNLGGLRRRVSPAQWLLRVAALGLVFAGGLWVGRATTASTGSSVAVTPADVQHAGTHYVETLAAFDVERGATSDDITQTRLAVYAAINGAARELMRLAPGQPWPAALVEAAERGRE